MKCAILFPHHCLGDPRDAEGCRLPNNHAGPHEFVAADGRVMQWETDLECSCEHCMEGYGDYCTTYWPKVRVFAFCRSMPGEPSMRTQLEAIQAAIGTDVDADCIIEDGSPALSPPSKRPALRQLLETAARGDRVIVAASRLLALTRAEVRAVIKQFDRAGVQVSSLDDGDLNGLRPNGDFQGTL
jgi:hypothetical protein